MVFDPNGDILEVDDGGIYRLKSPNDPTHRAWQSVNGNLRAIELASVAYYDVNHLVVGGAQDNGSPRQNAPGDLGWTDLTTGDGQAVAVDNTSMPGMSVQYSAANNLGDGDFARRVYNNRDTLVSTDLLGLAVTDAGKPLREVDRATDTAVYVLDQVDPRRLLLGTSVLYESADRGDTLSRPNGTTDMGPISALAYGGRMNGAANPDVAYAGSGDESDQPGALFLRSTAGGAFNLLTAYAGGTPRRIVLDPDNWQRAYVIDNQGNVWRTTDAGQSFTRVNGNLPVLGTSLYALALFPGTAAPDDEVVFVGGQGGVFATADPQDGAGASWVRFGSNLPHVLVTDLQYDRRDDVLVAGTLGRGAWTVPGVAADVGAQVPVLRLSGDVGGSNFATTFTPGNGPVRIESDQLSLHDGNVTTLASATITLTNVRDGNSEVLAADTTGTPITATYVQDTGTLILTGTAGASDYVRVLGTVTYDDAEANPNLEPRAVTFIVNDGATDSTAVTATVTVNPGPGPQVALAGPGPSQDGTASFTQEGGPVAVAPAATVGDPESPTLQSMVIINLDLTDGPAESLAADPTGTAITAHYDPATGTLTLSGADTLAHYQQVLRTLTYSDTAAVVEAASRFLSVTANDGTLNSPEQFLEVQVSPVNHAPVLDPTGNFHLPTVSFNVINPQGMEVFDLWDSAGPGKITDPDPNDAGGIAVVAVDSRHGTWQWSDNGGASWHGFDQPSVTHATLLPDDDGVRVRFVPRAGFSGTVLNGLRSRAWDQTGIAPGGGGRFGDTSVNGGHTAFSSAIGTVAVTVAAPVLPPQPPPPAPPPPAVRHVTAQLVSVRLRKKKRRLVVRVFFADTGALKREIASPFQKPRFKNIQVSVRAGNGTPDQVIVTARKRRRTVTAVLPG
jgi:hypothetical protein